MESIDFSQTGGYRLKQPTLAKMQRAYFEVLKAFLGYLQVPDTGNFILYGCEVSGSNITSGMMYIDGELCPFTESEGTTATKIKKNTVLEAIAFKSGANLPVLNSNRSNRPNNWSRITKFHSSKWSSSFRSKFSCRCKLCSY